MRLLLGLVIVATIAGCPPSEEEICPSGQVLCGGCYDPAGFQADRNNCGMCGVRCPATATCSAGQCVCPTGQADCGGSCVDILGDAARCGSCDTPCNLGTCSAGTCVCDAGTASCTGPGSQCVDPTSDADNCGSCRAACPALESCEGSTCTCPAPYEICSGVCSDTAADPANCGTCGVVCPLANAVCTGGECACPASAPTRCPAVTPTACVDLQTDRRNCGICSRICPTTASCTGGTCRCPAGPFAGCNGSCCAGGATCCASSGNCQTEHLNGVGGHFYDCSPLYTPEQTTLAAALTAADSWAAGTTDHNVCNSCVARRTGSRCAVWCYGTSSAAGHVRQTNSTACACPTPSSSSWR
jgi:hypothetical protein